MKVFDGAKLRAIRKEAGLTQYDLASLRMSPKTESATLSVMLPILPQLKLMLLQKF